MESKTAQRMDTTRLILPTNRRGDLHSSQVEAIIELLKKQNAEGMTIIQVTRTGVVV
jgi:ABC-type lipoprotein export system ATPase subunit